MYLKQKLALHQKWSFSLRISSVNMNKSPGNVLKKLLKEKFNFCAVWYVPSSGFMHARCIGVSPRLFLQLKSAFFNDNCHKQSTDSFEAALCAGL